MLTRVPAARVVFPPDARRRALAMIDESLITGSLTLSRRTVELEEAFAARHEAPFGVAVSSGTAALEIIFRSLGVADRRGPNAVEREVIVPANTFIATAAAVIHAGGRPRLADIDAATLALSEATVEAALTEHTVGVVMVHIGGVVSPEVEAIRRLCDAHGLFLVEDAAHAHGATLHGRPAGTFGVAAAVSFYPTKVITAGEGGMILTADEGLRDEARIYRDQGKASFLGGDHVRLGAAWRMSEVHAAVALAQLDHLDEFLERRRHVARLYDGAGAEHMGAAPLAPPAGCASNYYKYPVLLAPWVERQGLKERMRDRGVGIAGEVYASPLHHQPILADAARAEDLSVAEDLCGRHICLPIHSDMSDEEANYVVSRLEEVLDEMQPAPWGVTR